MLYIVIPVVLIITAVSGIAIRYQIRKKNRTHDSSEAEDQDK